MENLKTLFIQAVADHLKTALADARVKDPETNQALVKFNVLGTLKELGAKNAKIEVRQAKGFTFIRIEATDGAFYYPFEFSQRRQMTQAQYDSLADIEVSDVLAVAGIYTDGEDVRTSFKWDSLIVEGETQPITFGEVRKWNGTEYDAPIAE